MINKTVKNQSSKIVVIGFKNSVISANSELSMDLENEKEVAKVELICSQYSQLHNEPVIVE